MAMSREEGRAYRNAPWVSAEILIASGDIDMAQRQADEDGHIGRWKSVLAAMTPAPAKA